MKNFYILLSRNSFVKTYGYKYMKKIGILYGLEQEFPAKLLETINTRKIKGVSAEYITMGAITLNDICEYSVIMDRISHEIPFYRSYLKHSVLNGTKIINNPFWNGFDNSFFHNSLASKTGIKVPRTVVLPTKEHPYGASSESMRNLIYPLQWDEVFEYIGFPALIKPNKEHVRKSEFRVYNSAEFFSAYDLTGNIVMIMQQIIDYDRSFLCYTIGKKDVRIMNYDPRKPYNLRFPADGAPIPVELAEQIEKICIKVCNTLGLDFNAIEIGIKDNEPYVLEFYNPAPNSDCQIIKEENFNWLIEKTADYLIGEAIKDRRAPKEYNPYSILFDEAKSVPGKKETATPAKSAGSGKTPAVKKAAAKPKAKPKE